MKQIEDAFQELAERVLQRPVASFDTAETLIISEFYALWQARADQKNLSTQMIMPVKGVFGARAAYTPYELELLEKNGIIPIRGDGAIETRHLIGPVIRLSMDRILDEIADHQWSLCGAESGEFCVPDIPRHGIIPLTPTWALMSTWSGSLTYKALAAMNAAMASRAREYIFARDLNACPGL